MARWRKGSTGEHAGSKGEDGRTYVPPARRKRIIRVRWYAPIIVVAGIVGFVIFLVTGPDYNQRLVLERADGTEHEICAVRTIVGDRGVEPLDDGRLPGAPIEGRPHWLDADPPSELEIASVGAEVTFFDADGRAIERAPGEPWASALVEPVQRDDPDEPVEETEAPYVSLEARGGC